ncbi:MAG: carboxypeptidase regulatory-like domain-containing protein, partial [Acidimicrobiia bacterium]|nr:carboxypeptidase regulatory-like domain-containing protein [Acidimicrobiia bacterium]
GAGVDATDYDFGETPIGSISGTVTDEHGDPIPGVTITLTGTDALGDPVAAQVAVTDINGDYTFTNLAPGTYTITQTQPDGYGDVATMVGSAGGTVTGQDVVSDIALSSNEAATGYDFIEGYATISGTVYEDLNNNGTQDPGETGIDGATVRLNGTDPNGAITEIVTVTTADGNYTFTDLLAGTYTITQDQPTGYLDGTDTAGSTGGTAVNPGDEIHTISLTAGEDATNYDFGELPAASISGTVTDEHGNPIPGVTITLTGTDDLGAITPIVTTTDANGDYTFTGLRPGTYTITQTQPPGYGDGFQVSPTGDVSGANTIGTVVVGPGQSRPNNDFVDTYATIAGTVYVDLNNNGVRNNGEPGIGGVTVRLNGTDPNGVITEMVAITAADGSYQFIDLLAGSYVVTEETPATYSDGKDRSGSEGGVAVNPGDEINTIALGGGVDATGYDFGELGTVLSGTVFVDDDRDGTIDPDEDTRVEGVVVILLDDDGNEVARTITGPDGMYVFEDLEAGDYTVVQEQPDGFGTTTVNTIEVTVPVGGISQVDFGEDLGSIGNLVFLDVDGDGIHDPGEPGVGGVIVNLYDDDGNLIATTTTGDDGSYLFEHLPTGAYVLEFIPPDGLALTVDGAGSDVSDSDPDWITGITRVVTIGVDEETGLSDNIDIIDAGVVDDVIDLQIEGTVSDTTVEVGDELEYVFEVTNNSDIPVKDGARVLITFPPTVKPISVDAPGWEATIDGQTVTLVWVGVLMPGEELPPISVLTEVVSADGSLEVVAVVGTINDLDETTFDNNETDLVVTITTSDTPLPFTGFETGLLLQMAAVLITLGTTLVLVTRRRRDADT